MIFNYIRVSTIEQNTERQLRDVVCDRVYEEKISGKDTNRPQLQAMLSNIRSGDIINIHESSLFQKYLFLVSTVHHPKQNLFGCIL